MLNRQKAQNFCIPNKMLTFHVADGSAARGAQHRSPSKRRRIIIKEDLRLLEALRISIDAALLYFRVHKSVRSVESTTDNNLSR
jgi:hypothetical protein